MKRLFDEISYEASKMTTKRYSTSFSLGIRFLNSSIHQPIYAIYGFVRFADEIVDSFHGYDKEKLLLDFKKQTFEAIEAGISLNPILNSFQDTVNKYQIPHELIHTFLNSMEMDLNKQVYDRSKYEEYILGSAEVVGLMCLKIFVNGDEKMYSKLKFEAMKLGSAFQKINFLRDLKDDFKELGRSYFPNVDMTFFNDEVKKEIEKDIAKDFKLGLDGIKKLPKNARFGVYVAYIYYHNLFLKIQAKPATTILKERVRIPNNKKISLLFFSFIKHNLNWI
jgi:phytoene/squalene synthetase